MKKLCILILFTLVWAGCSRKAPPDTEMSSPLPGEVTGSESNAEEPLYSIADIDMSRMTEDISEQPVPREPLPPDSAEPKTGGDAAKVGEQPYKSRENSAGTAISGSTSSPGIIEQEDKPDPSPYLEDVERQVAELVNGQRATLGLPPLAYDTDLIRAARIRSREMYQNKYFAHGRPNGDGWQTVIQKDVPVAYIVAGENLAHVERDVSAGGQPAYGAEYWYNVWAESPPHYENFVRESYTHMGVGVFYAHKDGTVYYYATAIFVSI